jgi:protein NrfD
MREVVITSGRNMAHIDPHLTIWGWEIPVYLYLGGLVAGILFFSALYFLQGRTKELPSVVRVAPLLAPVLLGIGLFVLFLDLEYKFHVFRFYTAFRLESPMSWGSWTLAVIFPLSTVWALLRAREQWPQYRIPSAFANKVLDWLGRFDKAMAWGLLVMAALLGMYTGILLSAFNARPLWNTAILGPLFLVSGLSTGAAFNVLLSRNHGETRLLNRIDVLAIGVELFLIIHLLMGLLSSTQAHIDAAGLLLGGPFTAMFWIFVVGIGLVIPAILEVCELTGRIRPTRIPAMMVLFGGLMLRIVMVEAGQISQWVY